ncbi:hypothetical protein [Bartonella saheliensis]|nr:hypothetical protein [Bartonella saheliensis]
MSVRGGDGERGAWVLKGASEAEPSQILLGEDGGIFFKEAAQARDKKT